MSRRALFLATAGVVPLVLALVWQQVLVSRAGAPPAPTASDPGAAPLTFVDHRERVLDRRGDVTWLFDARRVDVPGSGDYLVYELRRAEFRRRGAAGLTLRADRAQIDQRTQNIALDGHLLAETQRGVRAEAGSAFWFESEGKFVAPQVDKLEWRDPARADQPPTAIKTRRLFFWPRESRLDLPDGCELTRGAERVQAAAGSALIEKSLLQMRGPLTVDAQVAADGEPGAPSKSASKHRVVLTGAEGAQLAYDGRTGAGRVTGGVTVDLPGDGVRVVCREATYSGRAQRRLRAEGDLSVTDPRNTLTASVATVALGARQAEFVGPVHLVHRATDGSTTLDGPRLTYGYATGARRAEAWGGVALDTGEAAAKATRVRVDLEGEQAVLNGAVRLVTRPTPPAAGAGEVEHAKHRPVTVTADKLVHRFAAGKRRSEATGSPRFQQGDRQGTCQRLAFDHERQVAVLDGGVRVWNKAGERARCGTLTYDLNRDEMRIERPVAAEFFLRDES